ncbi:MAG: hypothetical protein GF400_10870 [Candidatus Eisenbacteria bacterium]|nr:hypothetical protein [Candidatus Eisenbacteria bacterium]
MARRTDAADLPPAIVRAKERFEKWRSSRKSRTERIPDALWKLAVKLARQYGTWRTARALRLESTTLRRRVEAGGEPPRRPSAPRTSAPSFVELLPPSAAGTRAPECVIEVEDAAGAKLHAWLSGVDGAAIGAMARAFVERRRS